MKNRDESRTDNAVAKKRRRMDYADWAAVLGVSLAFVLYLAFGLGSGTLKSKSPHRHPMPSRSGKGFDPKAFRKIVLAPRADVETAGLDRLEISTYG
ncbi:MAG: hypothetical protein ACYTGH_07930 [Planctomycetota bacterium]